MFDARSRSHVDPLRLVAGPLAGRLADRYQAWRWTLFACAFGAGSATLLYLPVDGFWALLVVALVQAAALAPLAPLSDAMAVSASSERGSGFNYGWVRGAGSAAFIVGAIAAGHAAGPLGIAVTIWCMRSSSAWLRSVRRDLRARPVETNT